MPNDKLESFRVGPLRDRRRKLTNEDRKEIKALHGQGLSMYKLAARFGVSKRLIQFILYPERIKAARGTKTWLDYYSKEKRKIYMRNHRAYKKSLLDVDNS